MSPFRQAGSLTVAQRWLGAVLLAASLSACEEPDETAQLLSALQANHQSEPEKPAPASAPSVDINPRLLRRFQPLHTQLETPSNAITQAKTELGRMLFFEPRLSKDQKTSCNTCHVLANYGVDGLATSVGHRGQHGTRNSPTVYNAAGFFAQFWDGRAETVEEQAKGPILNPVEMALAGPEQGVKVLDSMPEYRAAFKQAFPGEADPLTFDNAARAIAAFERKLTTPSRWDDYLRGNQNALTVPELEGLKVFTNIGCMVCHTGEFVGGAMYQKVGIVEPWPDQRDQGRFAVTKQDTDRMMFKVPTLRNIAKTAPYFHDGSVPTLDAAVRRMGRYQLGLTLSDQEVAAIVTWLGSLTGELPAEYIAPPVLPASTSATPSADPT
ncbi:MAG TPA: cytochrome-c peroxidase [Polyangiaceae bacterium]|nr:cytochrome-c peroxidase [Polyangiaceae bacterium]